jgi:putative peptidoglycan lipid II flippase
MGRLTKVTLLIATFFAFDKAMALLRQIIIARQFSLSAELDAFNVANNIPDLLYAVISGGALAIAFIPVLSGVLTQEGRGKAWELFSRIANLAFLVTGAISIVIALLADVMVRSEVGIAPGFGPEQQALVTEMMRLNLVATMIFSISGLVSASLQANQHFLLPAAAPVLYNVGQIFGALILAPDKGYRIAGFVLPALGLGVKGLVYGVIAGALLHLLIQVPGMIKYNFRWIPSLGLDRPEVQKVLRLMGPRLLTMLCMQLIFIVRDNLASRLASGAVSALAYGWMIQQVPETLIGTAIGTALLPTLSEMVALDERQKFKETIEKALKILIALTIPIAVVMSVGLKPLAAYAFKFDAAGTELLMWVTRGYLLGLTGHTLLELSARSFYAQQKPYFPLIGAVINLAIYVGLGYFLYQPLGAAGISVTDSVAFTLQGLFLLFFLNKKFVEKMNVSSTLFRSVIAAVVGGGITFLIAFLIPGSIASVIIGLVSLSVGMLAVLPFIFPELRIWLRL